MRNSIVIFTASSTVLMLLRTGTSGVHDSKAQRADCLHIDKQQLDTEKQEPPLSKVMSDDAQLSGKF